MPGEGSARGAHSHSRVTASQSGTLTRVSAQCQGSAPTTVALTASTLIDVMLSNGHDSHISSGVFHTFSIKRSLYDLYCL